MVDWWNIDYSKNKYLICKKRIIILPTLYGYCKDLRINICKMLRVVYDTVQILYKCYFWQLLLKLIIWDIKNLLDSGTMGLEVKMPEDVRWWIRNIREMNKTWLSTSAIFTKIYFFIEV